MPQPRDLMAPDTEPTDEELATVMRAVRESIMESKRRARARLQADLETALAQTRKRSQTG